MTRLHLALAALMLVSALGGVAAGWAGARAYATAHADGAEVVLVPVPLDCGERQRTNL